MLRNTVVWAVYWNYTFESLPWINDKHGGCLIRIRFYMLYTLFHLRLLKDLFEQLSGSPKKDCKGSAVAPPLEQTSTSRGSARHFAGIM